MSFGWAYVGCDDIAITSMAGPSGSVLVRTGTYTVSGSENFTLLDDGNQNHSLLLTGSLKVSGSTSFGGDVVVVGNLTANSYNVVNTSVTEIEASGSTSFGNDFADKHILTGTLVMAGNDTPQPAFVVTGSSTTANNKIGILTNAPTSNLSVSGSISFNYTRVSSATHTLSALDTIVGVTRTTATTINLPSANNTPGRVVFIKDEAGTQPRTSVNKITISPNGSETIDGQTVYYVMGSRAAISLYSNGSDGWLVF
tara:strand:+ start:1592 stop:2356 length:765 start_codon:yes stop_codon:yes gene_type:complete